jgi:Prokaryotic E2 family A/Prokaryotic homologs of the JAB domain/ThiF family
MADHPMWNGFGKPVDENGLPPGPAKDLAQAIRTRNDASVELTAIRHEEKSGETVLLLKVEVQRPQKLAHPIRQIEPIALLVTTKDMRPGVFSARDDFPDTPHQNWVPQGCPASLCVDDRPWPEAKLAYTPADLLWRIELWLSKAARGELHDPAQPLDPIFLRGGDTVLLPPEALADTPNPVELGAHYRPENPGYIIASPSAVGGFVVVSYQLPPQAMPRMRYAPTTLGGLHGELLKGGINLFADLKKRLTGWAGLDEQSRRRLADRLILVVQFPVSSGNRTANDVRAFLTAQSAGEIGVALGALLMNMDGRSYSRCLQHVESTAASVKILPAEVHLLFNREMAANISGHEKPDLRRAVLVGAGSLGSQLAVDLAREGMFRWTVVDGDTLLPHNFGRHALLHNELAAPKAIALVRQLGELIREKFAHYQCDVLEPPEDKRAALAASFADADIIIDASASVAVSRHLSDLSNAQARRVSVFFNPAGTAAVLMAEDQDRAITLRDLEAQYHRLVLSDPALKDHLQEIGDGVRYGGSCRALTNRIPATRAALLSALVARGIVQTTQQKSAEIRIWTCTDDGAVHPIVCKGQDVFHVDAGDWRIHYDQGLLDQLAERRKAKLPNETGGVLLGIADMSRKSIHIAHGLAEPADSKGSITAFERGIAGLSDDIEAAAKAAMHQLRYVGEWHSHPRFTQALPSGKDILQLAWLGSELTKDGLPGLMMIAGDYDDFRLAVALACEPELDEPEQERRNGTA